MSICRSEVLFSSMRDSATGAAIAAAGGSGSGSAAVGSRAAMGASGVGSGLRDSLIGAGVGATDSLIMGEDGCGDFSYSEQVKVNKNNYTLTFSGGGPNYSSMFGSMMTSSSGGGAAGAVPPADVLAGLRLTAAGGAQIGETGKKESLPISYIIDYG